MPKINAKKSVVKTRPSVADVPDPIVSMTKKKRQVPKEDSGVSNLGIALRTLGGAAGTYFGNPTAGVTAGALVSRLLGHGDYEVKTNSLIAPNSSPMNSAAVVMGPDGRRGVRIQEREFVGTVLGSTTFSNKSYVINPANAATFPWLSTIATNFDEWKPNGIAFSFRSTSAAFNGSNQALGVVVGATEYDPVDAPYATRLEMESSAYAVSGTASGDWVHLIECDISERGRNVLKTATTQTVSTQASELDYHLGTFQIATEGQSTAGQVLGELWVSYDITFYKKQLFGGQLGNNVNIFTIGGVSSGFNSGTAPLGTYTSWVGAGNMSVTALSNTLIRLNNVSTGYYQLQYLFSSTTQFTGASGVGVFAKIVSGSSSNVALVTSGLVPYVTQQSNAGGAQTVSSVFWTMPFQVTGPNPVIDISTVSAAYPGATYSQTYLVIMQTPPPSALATNGLSF